jgi:hypothetical protein
VVIASPAAAIPGSDDRGLLDLCGEVTRLRHEADLIEVQRVWPHDDEIERILCGTGPRKERIEAAELYAVESGHREASNDVSRLLARADGLMEQMLAMPANTVVGRRAKVEVLLAHLDEPNWRASDEEAGWEFRAVRTLLRELISI